MAGAEGTVIACHTNEEFDAQMDEAYEAGKLVRRTRALRPDRSPSCVHLVKIVMHHGTIDRLHRRLILHQLRQFYTQPLT